MNHPLVEDNAAIMNKINIEYHSVRSISQLWKRKDFDVVFRLFSVTVNIEGKPMINYAPDISAIVDAMYTRTKEDFLANFEPYNASR